LIKDLFTLNFYKHGLPFQKSLSKKPSMQERHLFEYAIIRIVPRVERQEFINAGIIMYCAAQKFLQVKSELNNTRLLAFCKEIDLEEIQMRLQAIEYICSGSEKGGPIGALPIASRFRWLTAAKSTPIQTSPVHIGLCIHAEDTLLHLFKMYVV
jgi:Protein of unknown function (DUF3037)